MGFDDGKINFGDLSYSQLCKRAGNAWNINVASLIMKRIYELESAQLKLSNSALKSIQLI